MLQQRASHHCSNMRIYTNIYSLNKLKKKTIEKIVREKRKRFLKQKENWFSLPIYYYYYIMHAKANFSARTRCTSLSLFSFGFYSVPKKNFFIFFSPLFFVWYIQVESLWQQVDQQRKRIALSGELFSCRQFIWLLRREKNECNEQSKAKTKRTGSVKNEKNEKKKPIEKKEDDDEKKTEKRKEIAIII